MSLLILFQQYWKQSGGGTVYQQSATATIAVQPTYLTKSIAKIVGLTSYILAALLTFKMVSKSLLFFTNINTTLTKSITKTFTFLVTVIANITLKLNLTKALTFPLTIIVTSSKSILRTFIFRLTLIAQYSSMKVQLISEIFKPIVVVNLFQRSLSKSLMFIITALFKNKESINKIFVASLIAILNVVKSVNKFFTNIVKINFLVTAQKVFLKSFTFLTTVRLNITRSIIKIISMFVPIILIITKAIQHSINFVLIVTLNIKKIASKLYNNTILFRVNLTKNVGKLLVFPIIITQQIIKAIQKIFVLPIVVKNLIAKLIKFPKTIQISILANNSMITVKKLLVKLNSYFIVSITKSQTIVFSVLSALYYTALYIHGGFFKLTFLVAIPIKAQFSIWKRIKRIIVKYLSPNTFSGHFDKISSFISGKFKDK